MPNYMDMTAANALLKEYYDDQRVHNMVYRDNPWLAMVPKDEEAGGEYIPIPVIFETSMGASSNFGVAQTNQVAAQSIKFLLTRKTGYSLATIQNEVIKASASDKTAFLRVSKVHIDGAIRREKNRIASFMFRAGTGSIGQISSITAGGLVTLVNAPDIVHFGVNQTLQANSTDGGATPRAALGYVVGPIDRNLGTFNVSTSLGGAAALPALWAANDFLLTQGDNNATLSGLNAWIPATAPTSTDSFYGVNRSADATRLAGVRPTNTATMTIEEALTETAQILAREGSMPEHGLLPFASWGSLEKALGARVNYVTHEGPAEIMFRGIKVNGANTTIDVFPDRSCIFATLFMLQIDTWKLYSLDPVPHIIRYTENEEMLRVYNADASELRCGDYANLGCEAPGWNAQAPLGN